MSAQRTSHGSARVPRIDLPRRSEASLRDVLSQAGSKLLWVDSAQATFRAGTRLVQLSLEPGDCAHLCMDLVPEYDAVWQGSGRSLMQLTSGLPADVRVAGGQGQRALVADLYTGLRTESARHAFVAKLSALTKVFDGAQRGALTDPLEGQVATREELAAAIAQLEGGDQGLAAIEIVRRDEGWELRVRIHGDVLPVRLDAIDGDLRVYRVIAADPPAGSAVRAMAEHALRVNSRLRFARIELRDGHLEAASRAVNADAVDLARTARAVASAAGHVTPIMRAFSEHTDVARSYLRTFVPSPKTSANTGALLA